MSRRKGRKRVEEGICADELASRTRFVRARDDGIAYMALSCERVRAGNLNSCILLRTRRGAVWFLRAEGAAWVDDCIDDAEAMLDALGGVDAAPPAFGEHIAYHLGLSVVERLCPALVECDPRDWGCRNHALVLALDREVGERACSSVEDYAARVGAIEAAMKAELGAAVFRFAARLDRECVEMATSGGRLDTVLYNYLVVGPRRDWRLQFARTFPLLLRSAATEKKDSDGARIREAVAAGVPMVEFLRRLWGVSSAAVRSLIGVTPDLAGRLWKGSPRLLVRLLDCLRPEDRPGMDRTLWEHMVAAVELAERVFQRPDGGGAVGRAWLRELGRGGFRALKAGGRRAIINPETVVFVDRFRQQLAVVLSRIATREVPHAAGNSRQAAVSVADRALLDMGFKRLVEVSLALAREHAALEEQFELELFLLNDTFWPLMPTGFTSSDGGRRISMIANRGELAAIGRRLKLCFKDGRDLTYWTRECSMARAFMVLFVDEASREPMSVAEIHVGHQQFRGAPTIQLAQHNAASNVPPSPACTAALRETLRRVSLGENLAHLEEGRRMAQRKEQMTPEVIRRAEQALLEKAFRNVLGADAFAEMSKRAIEEAARM